MLTAGLLYAARIIDLAKLDLRREAHHMAEIEDVGRESRQNIKAILRKSLFPKEVHRVGVSPEQEGRIEQREIRQTVADFRKALEGIRTARLQRLQILTEQIRVAISQPLVGEEIRFVTRKRTLRARVAELLQVMGIGHKIGVDPQQQIRRELLGMGSGDQRPGLLRTLACIVTPETFGSVVCWSN